jgi:membrane protein implicated in regulation of membrane protease activity
MLTLMYMAFAAIGCLYVLIAAFLGHVTDSGPAAAHGHAGGHAAPGAHGGHGAQGAHGGPDGPHAAGAAAGHYGMDGSGHSSVSAADPGVPAFHFPFFSPLALATVVAAIGGWGLIAKFGLHAGDGASLAIALPCALATAYGVTYAGWKLVSGSRGSSVIRMAEMVGTSAEVTTPIPQGGLGEAATMVGGERYTAPAREAQGQAVARGALVTVVAVAGSTLVVRAGQPGNGS